MTAVFADPDEAVADIPDGATVLIGGFGPAGQPIELIDALRRHGARELTVVNNNAGNGDTGLAALLATGNVRKIICSFPRQADSWVFDDLYRSGKIELELVPQGNLAERMRAAGAGIGAFFCPTGVGTPLAEGKEQRTIDGRDYVLEYPIKGDFALIKAHLTGVLPGEVGDDLGGGEQPAASPREGDEDAAAILEWLRSAGSRSIPAP
ncbi:MAG TPA: 3-oxoacid CoA-transferase subunit A, partial [Burkholderiales bacterium]|nr:3-oxoacid CoA-transferase subunit A [Burkholderiales bacterium]